MIIYFQIREAGRMSVYLSTRARDQRGLYSPPRATFAYRNSIVWYPLRLRSLLSVRGRRMHHRLPVYLWLEKEAREYEDAHALDAMGLGVVGSPMGPEELRAVVKMERDTP